MQKKVLSVLVDNTSGVLSRISGLFTRRGYNIDSISAGTAEDPRYSRITVVCQGDELELEQIEHQVAKLEDVRQITELNPGQSVCRELVLIKVKVAPEQRPSVVSVVDIFRANIVDVEKDSMIIEMTGNQSKIDAFIRLLDGYEILEMVRTGLAGLTRGTSHE